jgi:hypothetical protein
MRILPGWWVVVPAALVGAGVVLGAGLARADEPHNTTEPRVMSEPGEVVNVIDAFDDGTPYFGKAWSLNIGLGFNYTNKSAKILRETSIAAPGLTTGGFTTHLLNVADYSETTARLAPRVDVGLYHDIAAHISLPIILSNTRGLSQTGGVAPIAAATAGTPADGGPLFSVPFQGPTRSGLEHIAAGFDFDILDQARDRTKPTWLFGFEGRFSVGTPMHACNPSAPAGQLKCADPSDIKRNGNDMSVKPAGTAQNPIPLEGTFTNQDRGAGVTRGTTAIEVHTLMSRRIKYVEPYGGFNALFEFANSSSDYGLTNLDQSLVNHPPLVGSMILGVMIIPWENREKFGRLTFDLRFMGQYHSEGRDYSELFDALGSSAAASLRQPVWSGYLANPNKTSASATPSVIDTGSQKVYTTGLTDVLAYGSFRGSASIMWQASEYVKFQFGLGYAHDQGHVITGDAPCNPSTKDVDTSGPCHTSSTNSNGSTNYTATGLPNPNYRAVINDVGRRFWVDGSDTFDLFASGVVMF